MKLMGLRNSLNLWRDMKRDNIRITELSELVDGYLPMVVAKMLMEVLKLGKLSLTDNVY